MGIDNVYQKVAHFGSGNLRIDCGDVSYTEFSGTTQYIHIPVRLSHIVAGFAFPDGTNSDTMVGRASPRIGEISDGMCAFSISDVTVSADDRWTYIAIGW